MLTVRRVLLFLVYYLFCDAAMPQSADSVIARAESTALSAKTLSAEFTLSIRWELRDTTEEKSGRLFIKKGGAYRVELGPTLLISDGETLWRHSPKLKQVVINHVTDLEADFQPGAWFFRYSDQYKPVGIKPDTLFKDPCMAVSLVPKTKAARFTRLKVWISDKSALPRKIETEDDNGNKAGYSITKIARDTELENTLFKYMPAKGIEIIDLRQ